MDSNFGFELSSPPVAKVKNTLIETKLVAKPNLPKTTRFKVKNESLNQIIKKKHFDMNNNQVPDKFKNRIQLSRKRNTRDTLNSRNPKIISNTKRSTSSDKYQNYKDQRGHSIEKTKRVRFNEISDRKPENSRIFGKSSKLDPKPDSKPHSKFDSKSLSNKPKTKLFPKLVDKSKSTIAVYAPEDPIFYKLNAMYRSGGLIWRFGYHLQLSKKLIISILFSVFQPFSTFSVNHAPAPPPTDHQRTTTVSPTNKQRDA